MAIGGDRNRSSPDGSPAPGAGDDETLPCGARLAALWEDRSAVAGHTGCPHCRAALDDLAVLDRAVAGALTARPGPAHGAGGPGGDGAGPAARAPGDDLADAVTARVMDVVRTELRPGRTLPLGGADSGDDWITEAAAARVLRAAADAVPGVAAGSCRIGPLRLPASGLLPLPGTRLPRGPLRVRLEVAMSARWTVPGVAALVRERVAAAVDRELGLEVSAIDVSVIDLLDEPGPGDGPAGARRGAP
ncbi:hypothetical protein [Streptomyces sp. NPDC018031]|uniref:hypothetical protein n=1 Tax=Streptomyces sp. NPDC018031 TaxID=3365033 RepID=UPI0037A619B8